MPQRTLQTVKKAGYQTGLLLLLVCSPAQAGDILVTVEGIQATGTERAARQLRLPALGASQDVVLPLVLKAKR